MYRDQFEEFVRFKRVDPLLTRMQNALRLSNNLRYNSSTILCACTYWIEITFTITSAYFKVYHFQKASGKSVWKVNGSPTHPTFYKQCLGSLTSHSILYEEGPWDRGPTGFFYSKKTRKSNRLQMTSGNTFRQLFKDPHEELVRPGFETAASHSVDLCLSTWS